MMIKYRRDRKRASEVAGCSRDDLEEVIYGHSVLFLCSRVAAYYHDHPPPSDCP